MESSVTNPVPVSGSSPGGEAKSPIAVFLLDDHEVVRRGVRDLLEAEPDIRVVGEAGTASSALARIPALCPDVAVLDVRLPDGDGVSVCREIRSRMPQVACLMLTSFADDEALFDAVMAGAAGYVLKQIRGTDLVGAVRTVASGQSMLDPRAASQLMARLRDQQARRDPLAGLSAQERRILELIGEGLTNRQIGERMFLAEKTVKNYVSALFAKLGMERRTQAAAYAVRVFGEDGGEPHPGPAGSSGPLSGATRRWARATPAWFPARARQDRPAPAAARRRACRRGWPDSAARCGRSPRGCRYRRR
jgi:DNA-binding NarL/FixJ family response regulator